MTKDPSKTEKPTPKRINKAREEGNVPKSQEVGVTFVILGGLVALYMWIGYIAQDMLDVFHFFLSEAPLHFTPDEASVLKLVPWLSRELAKMIMPVLLVVGAVAFIVNRVQVGKLWTSKVFKPKLNRFNPISGMKRMFVSPQTFIRMFKSLMKAVVIGVAVYTVIKDEVPTLMKLYYVDARSLAGFMLEIGMRMTMYALIPMLIIASADLLYSRWSYIENLKMSKQEVKDEMRQMEGDPQVKSKQRQRMMSMMQRRMMQQVPKADVVITNPTHIAVALRYNAMEAPAPVVVAMGADKVAEKIKEIARENKVPIKENKPLARALYSQVQVGDMIPEDLYKAVAAILAQLWKNKGAGGGAPR